MADEELTYRDRLALDRTREAASRTLMAWIRTSLSMISFGFTIFKFLEVIQQESPGRLLIPHAPRNIGVALTSLGTFALVVATFQYRRHRKTLGPPDPHAPWDLALFVAAVLAVLGMLMFWGILFSSGPFG